jgi:hypothetical protein
MVYSSQTLADAPPPVIASFRPPPSRYLVQGGVSSMLTAWYAILQAGLLFLLVRFLGKSALTSCS